MYDCGNEITELLAAGYDYDEAVEMCEFVMGEATRVDMLG